MKNPIKRYFPIFVLPTLLAFMIAFLIPFILGLFLSFTEFRNSGKMYRNFTDSVWGKIRM